MPVPHPEQMGPLQRKMAISCHSLGRAHNGWLRLRLACIVLHFPQIKGGPFQERRNQKSPGQNKTTEKFLNHMACLRKMDLFVPRKLSLYPHPPFLPLLSKTVRPRTEVWGIASIFF